MRPDSSTELFGRLSGDKTSLMMADLEPVFGEHASLIIDALGKVLINNVNGISDLHRWRACLGAMPATQRDSWLSILGSLMVERRLRQ